jgi:hypothetical protein
LPMSKSHAVAVPKRSRTSAFRCACL